MRTTLRSVAVLVCLSCLAAALPASHESEQPALNVMSFNIRYGTAKDGDNAWPKRRDLVFDVIRRHDPDVIGLQEALRFQLDELLAALPGYRSVGVGRADGATKGEYAAVFYRADRFTLDEHGTFWLSDTPTTPGSTSWGNTIPRIATWARLIDKADGKGFYIYNAHFDHRSAPSRERSAALLVERAASRTHGDEPVVITGDFNAGEGSAPIRTLTDAKYVDTFRVKHPDATDVGTFNGFRSTRTGRKIDYVFVSPGLEVLEASILLDHDARRYPSDHFPVAARIGHRE